MESNDLYSEIRRVLPQNESIQVLSALRHDPLVWQSLQQPEFMGAALEAAGGELQCWSPGQLALFPIADIKPEVLRSEPLVPLGHDLQERALRTYQATQRSTRPPQMLDEAGLLALALRERRRLTGTWSGLIQEILPRPAQADNMFGVWRTALACLYAIIPDPLEMLRALLPKTPYRVALDWVILSQLSQPLSRQDHATCLTQVLKSLPVSFQLGALRSLGLHGEEALAADVASRLLVGHPSFSNLRTNNLGDEKDLTVLSNRALSLHQLGTYYQMIGDRDQALSLYSAAEITLQEWLAGLYLQRLNMRAGENMEEAGVIMDNSQLSLLASSVGWLNNELGVALVGHPYARSVLEQVPEEQDYPFLAIKRAAIMFESEPILARDLARRASQELLVETSHHGIPFHGEFIYSWRPLETLQILLDLGLQDEALSLSKSMIEARPVDLDLLHLTARILEQSGLWSQALEMQKMVVALDPANPTWRRPLAGLWSHLGDWRRSLSEWQTVLSLSTEPDMKDRLACAQAALQSGALEEARVLGEAILVEDANNGTAMGIMGQALVGQANPQAAVNYLVRATLLSPELQAHWLALASVQRDLGEPHQALETLRAAVTALPEEPEVQLAFGDACNREGLLAEALPHLRQAYTLSPDTGKAALLYGQALRRLGHTTEARTVFDKARLQWASHPEMAYEYAQVLLDQNDAEAALPVLENALRSGLPILDGYLLYAKILLGEYRGSEENWDPAVASGRMQQAEITLSHILEVDPNNLEARFLCADILREKGDSEEALAAYRQLANLPAEVAPDLGWRVQWGMARAAQSLNRPDIAVAAYQEACNARPDNILLHRSLAEALAQAALPIEALEYADEVLQMSSDDVDNLAWYAALAARLGDNQKAVSALERAVQINPHRPDLLVNLAQWQLSAGDLGAARGSLETVSRMEDIKCANQQSILRRAAQMYLRMEDEESALVCFEHALAASSVAEPGLYLEVAYLQARLGNHESALELAQKAQEENPHSLPILLLQSDLLAFLNRPQAALAVLERAQRVVHGSVGDTSQLSEEQCSLLGEIHERFTRLMLLEENLPAALFHAEKAFSLHPKQAGLAYRAANLSYSMLQNDRADRILAESLPEQGPLPQMFLEQGKDGLDLLCLNIESSLANHREDIAQEWVEGGWALAPQTPRLLAAEVRLLSRQGNQVEARKVHETVKNMVEKDPCYQPEPQPLWLVECALEAQAWNDALTGAENYAKKHPNEARAHLFYARVLVEAAEHQQLCAALGCMMNAPGPQVFDEASQEKFNSAIEIASRLANAAETARWHARGQAVFTPSTQTARVLAQMHAEPDDVAALIAALRQLNNRSGAMQVSRRYPQNGQVLLQLALCYLNDDSLEGLAIAEQAAQAMPTNALAHSAVGRLAAEVSAVNRAVESYSKALDIWPSEPEWHDAVGDLYMQIGTIQQAIWHRDQALTLVPTHARYASKLGEAFLAQGDNSSAVEYLERSTVLDSNQPDIWLKLASAYHMSGRLPQAMEAAKQAGSLNPTSAEGLLIAGETALAMNQVDQALVMAQDAVRREPENAAVVLFLSSILSSQGKYADSLAVLEAVSPSLKHFYPIAFERAKLICQIHGPQAALDGLEKLAKDHPDEPGLLSFLARTQAECGDAKTAERYAFNALQLDPDQPELALMLGRLQRKTGQLDQAIHHLAEAVRIAPDHLEAYLEMASVYQERREFIQALQVYRQAMQVDPSDYQAFYQSGLILRDNKDYSAAETMLRKAAELSPDNLSIRRQLVGVIALNLVHNKPEVSLT